MKTIENLLIVKVGTNVLTRNGEQLDDEAFERIGCEVRDIADHGTSVVLVSSGAITAGILGEAKRRSDISDVVELQRYAARGWDAVVQRWKSVIGDQRVSAALLTKHELHSHRTRGKTLNVISCCLAHGDVFVVNENDVISDDEIKFGDNDTLAAELAAACAEAKLAVSIRLILLTNIDGLRRDVHDATSLISLVTDIDEVAHHAGAAENNHSRGGMKTKLHAARTATASGVEMYIASGSVEQAIQASLSGKIGTRFALGQTAE